MAEPLARSKHIRKVSFTARLVAFATVAAAIAACSQLGVDPDEPAAIELDAEKRAGMYREAELMINADLPYVYLWVPQDIYGVSKRLKGWKPSADSRINLHDACVE